MAPVWSQILILILSLATLLSQLLSLGLLYYWYFSSQSPGGSSGNCTVMENVHPVVYNNTLEKTLQVNNLTTILREEEEWRFPKYSCPGTRLQKTLLISSHRFSETNGNGEILIMREPFVSCSKKECRLFALTHYSAVPGGYYAGTRSDRNKMRHLVSVGLGQQLTLDNAVFHITGWSGAACHDGKEWTYVGVDGPDNNAILKIKYGNQYTDTMVSYAKNILRTQESECVCVGGNCYLMVTDGSASGISECKVLKINKGKIQKVIVPSGRTKMTEECSCAAFSNYTIECVCRDNSYSAKRPMMRVNLVDDTAEIHLMCTPTYLDNPRPTDGSITGACDNDGSAGGGGVKGGFAIQRKMDGGTSRMYSRTVSTSSRDGMVLYKLDDGDPWTDTRPLINIGTAVASGNPGWYSFGFEIPGEDCDQPCIGIEMTHDAGATTWHSAATVVYCLTGNDPFNWDTETGVDMAL